MKAYVLSSAVLGKTLLSAVAVLATNSVRPGIPSNCSTVAMALPSDTCESLASKHHLQLSQFLAYNPQIGGVDGCPQNIVAWNYYCISSSTNKEATATTTPITPPTTAASEAAPQTTLITITITPSPGPKSISPSPTPSLTTKTLAPTTSTTLATTTTSGLVCAINDCWRAFKQAKYGAAVEQAKWCTSLLEADPPVTETGYDNFPGIPKTPQRQCAKLGPADRVMSSYCRCYTDGQMVRSTATGVDQ